uniref:condensin complex subunit 2 isoform X3 n=1 Tax=Ciona intestinalis TaxID=7719 RepID=UPI00089DAFC2|nr:condensin complex subunit 2 isoform X3 [Ciona intestinalis]|eukprot:XP_018669190.1 condensin complex subunit 2 isoform X3 [Ciona intestinalis]
MSSPATPMQLHNISSPISPNASMRRKSKRRSIIGEKAGSIPCSIIENQEQSRHRRHSRGGSRNLKISKTATVEGTAERRWTKDELCQHYAQCMKLHQENKINHKNAFDLKLIEHMGEMILKDGSLNFRVAGGTIIAGAKIYASRVDAIHSDIYRVLSSLGSGEKDDAEPDDGETDSQEPKSKKRKKNSKILETNEANLRLNMINTCVAVDGIDRKHNTAIDAASCDSLKFNNMPISDDGTTLLFDYDFSSASDADMPTEENTSEVFWELHKSLPQQTLMNNVPLCETFKNTSNINAMFNLDQEIKKTAEKASESLSENEEIQDDFSCAAADDADDNIFAESNNDNNNEAMEDTVFETLPLPSATTPMDTTLTPAQLNAVSPGDYSYFKQSNVLSVFEGNQHWNRHKSKRTSARASSSNDDADDTVVKKKVKKAARKIFSEDLEKPTVSKKLQPQKCSKQKLDALKANKEFQVLQCKESKSDILLGCLVLRIVLEKLTMKKINFSGLTVSNSDKQVVCNIRCASDEPCQQIVESSFEDNDDFLGNEDQTQIGFPNYTASDSVFPDFTQNNSHHQAGQAPDANNGDYTALLEGDHLISQPRKVEKIPIGFAKRAKRIDVKRLKGAMWSLLHKPTTERLPAPEHQDETITNETDDSQPADNELQTSVEPDISPKNDDFMFSDLYKKLPSNMSESLSENLSVPLAFTCLLHLANEKQLKISHLTTLSDLKISHGL